MTDEAALELKGLLTEPGIASIGPDRRSSALGLAALDTRLGLLLSMPGVGKARADLVRALIYLWHDHLEESHRLSQELPGRDGGYLHGLMHRREPDYGNAKYWFARVGAHPIHPALSAEVATLSLPGELRVAPGEAWDAAHFVDACAAAEDGSARAVECARVQAIEFRLLLGHFLA